MENGSQNEMENGSQKSVSVGVNRQFGEIAVCRIISTVSLTFKKKEIAVGRNKSTVGFFKKRGITHCLSYWVHTCIRGNE